MKLKDKIILWSRLKSPWLLHFNAGACNGCDIEIVDALTPRYDLERFGAVLKSTPRHADILVISGPLTRQQVKRAKRIYDQMPEPKFVMAVGACACTGGIFDGCYGVVAGVDKVLPVSIYIPGCPVRPEALLDGAVKLLASLEAGSRKQPSKA